MDGDLQDPSDPLPTFFRKWNDPGAPGDRPPLRSASALALVAVSAVAVIYYGSATGWSVREFARFVLGALALWGPLAAALSLLLRAQVPDPIVRFTLSGVASYALTTLAYFAFAVLGFEAGFYVAQVGLAAGVLVAVMRRPGWWRSVRCRPREWRRWDWLLTALVAASLVVNVNYQTTFTRTPPSDDLWIALYADHLYHTGLAYELGRHVPPVQQAIRAGTPERAYHMFSQLTTMLLGRYTGQANLLRVHIGYHYAVIEVALCLLLYSLAVVLTGSRAAGYLAAALVYVAAFAGPRLLESPQPSFYFTPYPYVSSGLDPVRTTSPQMYSGLVVMYGILLGVALAARQFHRRAAPGALLVVTALMVAASSRFRIQIFLPMLPGFVLVMGWAGFRRRHGSYAVAAAVAVAGGALLLAETRSRVYLPGSATLGLGYNHISESKWINSWPLASALQPWLRTHITDPAAFGWTWQVVSLPAFVILNMIGVVPLAAMLAYLRRAPARRELTMFTVLVVCLVVGSTLGAMVLTMDYDSYSVGGQLLLHTGWYVFPFVAPAGWLLYRGLQRRLRWPPALWSALALAGGVACVTAHWFIPPPWVSGVSEVPSTRLNADERAAMGFLLEHTPPEAVVISNKWAWDYTFVFTGLAGRAVYIEGGRNTVYEQSMRLYPTDDRFYNLIMLWGIAEPISFCGILLRTPATHVFESAGLPLRARAPRCLRKLWVSPERKVTIWEIIGRPADPAA
jgi:hypothetical protein